MIKYLAPPIVFMLYYIAWIFVASLLLLWLEKIGAFIIVLIIMFTGGIGVVFFFCFIFATMFGLAMVSKFVPGFELIGLGFAGF